MIRYHSHAQKRPIQTQKRPIEAQKRSIQAQKRPIQAQKRPIQAQKRSINTHTNDIICDGFLWMEKMHSGRTRMYYNVNIVFHKNEVRPIIRSSGTISYSLLYFNSRQGYSRLKYLYPGISVKIDLLQANTKIWKSTSSWTARVQFLSGGNQKRHFFSVPELQCHRDVLPLVEQFVHVFQNGRNTRLHCEQNICHIIYMCVYIYAYEYM